MRAVVGRAALIILAATATGRALGLVRDMVTSRYFGATSATDAYFLAYKIPYLLVLMAGGALTAVFVPILTYRISTGRRQEAWDLSVNLGNLIFLALLGLTGLLVIIAPWIIPLVGFGFSQSTADKAVFLFRLLMIGVVFDSMSGLVAGMLNSLKRFALVAFAPALGTLVMVVVLIALAQPLKITSLAIGSVLGSVTGFLLLLPGLRDQGIRYRPRIYWKDPAIREVGGMVWPVLLGSAVGKISIFSDQVMASLLVVGSVSSLSYADKLFQLPLGLFVAGITVPIFPLLSERVRNPIVAAIYQGGEFKSADTLRTGWVLLFESLGLYSYAGRDTLTRVFYAYHDTRTPVKISAAAVFLNIGVSYLFMRLIGVAGLTLGTSVALTVNFVVLIELLRRKIGPMGFREILKSLLRVTGAAVGMGVIIWPLDYLLAHRLHAGSPTFLIRTVVGIGSGAGVFFLLSWLFRVPEAAEIVGMLGAVFRRKR